jgi:hypothetical protein
MDKPLLTPLKRENKGIKDDPQFSPYFPTHKFIVFHDYGHPTHLGSKTFTTKKAAQEWIDEKGK